MKSLSKLGLPVLMLLFLLSSACSRATREDNSSRNQSAYSLVEVGEFEQLMAQKDNVLIDFRTPEETAEGKIREDAMTIDYTDDAVFYPAIAQLDKNKTYLVYCRSGRRSGEASKVMLAQGFQKVYNLNGGIEAWKADHPH